MRSIANSFFNSYWRRLASSRFRDSYTLTNANFNLSFTVALQYLAFLSSLTFRCNKICAEIVLDWDFHWTFKRFEHWLFEVVHDSPSRLSNSHLIASLRFIHALWLARALLLASSQRIDAASLNRILVECSQISDKCCSIHCSSSPCLELMPATVPPQKIDSEVQCFNAGNSAWIFWEIIQTERGWISEMRDFFRVNFQQYAYRILFLSFATNSSSTA